MRKIQIMSEFSENDVVNYVAFVEKKRARNKNLKIKRNH